MNLTKNIPRMYTVPVNVEGKFPPQAWGLYGVWLIILNSLNVFNLSRSCAVLP